jgi:hypothetical protein
VYQVVHSEVLVSVVEKTRPGQEMHSGSLVRENKYRREEHEYVPAR